MSRDNVKPKRSQEVETIGAAPSVVPHSMRRRRRDLQPFVAPQTVYQRGMTISGKYLLITLLGEGGMGSVWLARNTSLEIEVAVKLVRTELTGRLATERLRREAQSAARLQHPGIVRVFDFGTTKHGDPFIVMEVVRGDSLAHLMVRRSRLEARDAVQLLLPIAGALGAAHVSGIVHRDVKPENIILMASDADTVTPKLVDFGVAKLGEDRSDQPKLTVKGQVLGSLDYMSPEQATSSSDVDQRADIWSFAVILYELIVGERPFVADSRAKLISTILRHEPAPITDYGAGDERLWQILRRALAKDPDQRWPDMGAFGRACAQWAVGAGLEHDISGTKLSIAWLGEPAQTWSS